MIQKLGVSIAMLICSAALAGDHKPGPGPHPGRVPPPEAVAACSGKADGDVCSIAFGERTVNGKCGTPPSQSVLACKPDFVRRGPPPEAISACSGKAAGEACSVNLHGTARAGKCEAPPSGEGLACRPDGMKGPHGPPPSEG